MLTELEYRVAAAAKDCDRMGGLDCYEATHRRYKDLLRQVAQYRPLTWPEALNLYGYEAAKGAFETYR